MRGVFFYAIGTACAGGILFRSFFDVGLSGLALLGIVAGACVIVSFILGKSRVPWLIPISIVCIFFTLGALRLDYVESKPSAFAEYAGREVVIMGSIVREPDAREATVHLYVRPEGSSELILVTADRFAAEAFRYGDTVTAEGTLKRPETFETDGGRTFDYPGYLKARGVEFTLPFADVSVLARDETSFTGKLYRGKRAFMDAVEAAIPEPASGLGEGVLLGVKRALGEDLERTFRETGIIHIVVLSGYNVMIVVSTVMHLLTFFFFPRTRLVLGISAIIVFALLVGLSATVVRACIMAVLLLIAQTSGRRYAALRALMLAGIGMLALNPYLLVHDPGFQLSFLATLGLILLSPYIEKRLTKIPETIGVRGFVTATIATQLFVLPLLLFQTGLFSVVSVFVNVLVLPMVPIAMLLTFLTGTLGMVSHTLGTLIGFLAHLSLSYIILVAELFGTLPFASFSVPVFPFGFTVLMYAGLGAGIVWLTSRNLPATIPVNRNSGVVKNDYEGWVIEEEKETPPEARSASGGVRERFPSQ